MSEVIKFERTIFKFDVYGKEYSLRAPSTDEVISFQDKAVEVENKSDAEVSGISLTIQFLDSLGLPKDIGKKMEIDHLMQLFKRVMPEAKK